MFPRFLLFLIFLQILFLLHAVLFLHRFLPIRLDGRIAGVREACELPDKSETHGICPLTSQRRRLSGPRSEELVWCVRQRDAPPPRRHPTPLGSWVGERVWPAGVIVAPVPAPGDERLCVYFLNLYIFFFLDLVSFILGRAGYYLFIFGSVIFFIIHSFMCPLTHSFVH